MPTMPIEQVAGPLVGIIEKLAPGEEIVLTRAGEPVATLRATTPISRGPRRFGTLKGSVVSIAPDFDDIPDGFEDSLP